MEFAFESTGHINIWNRKEVLGDFGRDGKAEEERKKRGHVLSSELKDYTGRAAVLTQMMRPSKSSQKVSC